MRTGARTPRSWPEWLSEVPVPQYGLPGKTGISVWAERRRTGNRRGVEYRDGSASLQVITSMLPGPQPCSLLGGHGGQTVTVDISIAGQVVSFHGMATPEAWAVRADFTGYCLAVAGRGWRQADLALVSMDPHESIEG
jgi:hypothetical protein